MSSSSRSDGDSSFDVEELLEIGTRCIELRKEKEMLKESQSQNFELIKSLELHVKSLSEACSQDKEHIQNLERELMNCSQEIEKDKLTVTEETRKIIHSLISRAASVLGSDAESKEKMAKMSCQIHEYDCVVKQLKQELREEKMKAKDEADDLAQEMAELRYEMMHLLEEECKRRACIEKASLKKIVELEAQIKKETEQSLIVVKGLHEF